MPAHVIHLRRAWQVVGGGRVDLPTTWPAGPPGRVTLARKFHRPPVDPAAERILLRIGAVPGLIAARLDGRELPRGVETWPLPVDLPPASLLELDVDPPADGAPWGEIALRIEAIDPT